MQVGLWCVILVVSGQVAGCGATGGGHWYKGNTHTHTELCGHADSSPEAVARWYLERDYNFLVLSEHNIYIDPADVKLPADAREDFILVAGEEISGNEVIHTTGFNIDSLVDWTHNSEHKHEIIQSHVDGTIEAGGLAILNHPNFHYAVTADDMLPVDHLHFFELHNGHPAVRNEGDADHPSTEELWDELLTRGMLIYAVSSDDAHEFKTWSDDVSNPGRGWIMVRSEELTPDALDAAMRAGDFYATSGVMLRRLSFGGGVYRVAVDEGATQRALASPHVRGRIDRGVDVGELALGWLIEWVGPHGEVLASSTGASGEFRLEGGVAYVRCRVSFVRRSERGVERFVAWTQPVFTDDRAGAGGGVCGERGRVLSDLGGPLSGR